MAATRLHLELRTPLDAAVDPFRIATLLRLWVTTQPLDSLYGMYLRSGDAAGIVINSRHPRRLQNFTCAHELGHHVLGHPSATDHEEDVTAGGDGQAVREAAAQTFAASLLMPLPLVRRQLAQLGPRLRPEDVYVFSRNVDVSFTAAVWQLHALGHLERAAAKDFARRGAAAAKRALLGRSPLGDPRGDTWLIDAKRTAAVRCRVGDEVVITFHVADRSHVYLETTATDGGAETVEICDVTIIDGLAPGALQRMHVAAVARHAGQLMLRTGRRDHVDPASECAVEITVVERRVSDVGLDSVQRAGYLANFFS